MNDKPSVLIVGAGPTGLVMAHELARDGVECRVVDKSAHRAMQSRAIAIHSRTVETFELMGLVDDFLAAGHRITGVNVFGDSGRIAHVDFRSLDTRYPYVLGTPQDETERILEEHVGRLGVQIERNTELVALAQRDASVSARLRAADRTEEIEAEWVLGCDGAHSMVREQMGIPFSGATYPELFVLADVKIAGGLDPADAQVWLHRDGALAFFPLPEDRWRLIVANSPAEWKDQPSLEQCQGLVDERGPGNIRLFDPRWSAVFRIHRREAGRFRQGRVFLLGDAAHIHSPVGGQGMNMGIHDAVNLAWKLSSVLRNGGNPLLLDSYEAERKPIDEAVIRQTDRATRLVSLHGSVTRFVRDHLMSLMTRIPAVAEKLGETISGLAFDYRHSPIVEDHGGGMTGPAAGDRAPDAPLVNAINGTSLRLYDLFAQHRHTLLLLGEGSDEVMERLAPDLTRRLTVKHISGPGSGAELIDRERIVAARYTSPPAAYLIRPDGYIGFRSERREASKHLPPYLAKIFTV
jgi:2-polyprenyl-6-methoxyphenol hydroxylase-like FAD-dependent oxidoreductase